MQLHFFGRYQLQEIDITASGNEQYLKLYKYEIPVLFLEGQFLCKHYLDSELLERKLQEFSQN